MWARFIVRRSFVLALVLALVFTGLTWVSGAHGGSGPGKTHIDPSLPDGLYRARLVELRSDFYLVLDVAGKGIVAVDVNEGTSDTVVTSMLGRGSRDKALFYVSGGEIWTWTWVDSFPATACIQVRISVSP